ncbi:MAG: hypothetical protein IPM04_13640 [Saprospiraceae bacterium]|nr:hypothetical protein [Candidatus Brachybacter algidus]MBK8748858.1 hypothetical protein [Candidatus Brachybacter algidus]
MNKLPEEAMKNEGMSKKNRKKWKKLMNDVMPALEKQLHNSRLPSIYQQTRVTPKRDPAKIVSAF